MTLVAMLPVERYSVARQDPFHHRYYSLICINDKHFHALSGLSVLAATGQAD